MSPFDQTLLKFVADNKINMPSGQGGLTRYFDEYKSKIEISPGAVIVLVIAMMILVIILHQFGGGLFS
jgi:preprotein translocase subunit Sec61beta